MREVPRGEPGEIVVRGYNVMQGYFEDAERTAETIDADGWLHTGDIGTMDADGYIAITDRKKDMFIVGGFNAYPAEIENLLLAHPDLAQVAVVGVPDERMGEVGVAFAVPTAGTRAGPRRARRLGQRAHGQLQGPARVVLLDALPMNASNKVLKYQLRDCLAARRRRFLTLRQVVGRLVPMADVTPLHDRRASAPPTGGCPGGAVGPRGSGCSRARGRCSPPRRTAT